MASPKATVAQGGNAGAGVEPVPEPEPPPACIAGSHWTTIVRVSSEVLHELPSGTGPSPTTSVTLTAPTAVHVKGLFAAELLLNEPLGADQLYVRLAGTGPFALAISMT
jgi:hypothetical protein